MTDPKQEIAEILRSKDNFLVASHYNPDGDAVGSMAALGYILKALGKQFTLYNQSGLPPQFDWLELPAQIATELPASHKHWLVALDSGDEGRLGKELSAAWNGSHSINIDHHLGNPEYGEYNWVDPVYSSVGEMIALLAKELGVPLSGALGEALYVAIVTDTGYFSYGNTRPETLRISAEILEQGLDVEKVNNRLQNQWTLNRLKLWSEVMGDAKLYHDGEVATVSIPAEALQRTGASVFDTDGLVNFVRRIKSVRVAISLREEGNNRTKFSLRSNGSLNVQRVAKEFGGGGHRNASGGSLNKPLDKAEKLLVKAVEQALEAAKTDEPGEL